MSLQDKVAVVTGGTKGVGGGIGRELATQGARVFVTGRSASEIATSNPRMTGIAGDHRDDDQVVAALSTILRDAAAIDILVNSVWGGYERMVAALGQEYGFTDIDGRRPRPLTLADV